MFRFSIKSYLIICLAIIIFTACKKAEDPQVTLGDAAVQPTVEDKQVKASNVLSSSVTLSWSKATKDGTEDPDMTYQVYYSVQENLSTLQDLSDYGTPYGDATADISTQTVEDLNSEKTYYFNVKAINSAGNGSAYEMTNATTTEATTTTTTTTTGTTVGVGTDTSTTSGSAPTNAATAVSFTDSNKYNSVLTGTVSITAATSESDVTHYVLYWGSDASTKMSGGTSLTSIAITGADVTYDLSSAALPSSATHLLVFTKNSYGEMTTGVSAAITDFAIPDNPAQALCFKDSDTSSRIKGNVTVQRASDESDVVSYVLYWGSNSTTKKSNTAIATFAASSNGNTVYTFPSRSRIKSGATHLLIYTANADGEMDTPVALTPINGSNTTCP
jgi:hypothetical protein